MEIDWTIVAFEMLNFGVLMWLLKRFLYAPVQRAIAKRRTEIEALRRETEAREAAATEARQRFEEQAMRLAAERGERIESALLEARTRADEVVERAREEARRLVEEAQVEVGQARRRVLEEMRLEVLSLAVDAAARVVERMDVSDVALRFVRRAALALRDRLDADPSARVDAWVGTGIDPSDVEAELRAALGPNVTIDLRTDPGIVAGVRLVAAGYEVEASASASLMAWYEERIGDEDGRGERLHVLSRVG